MRLKIFSANNMQEALSQIRKTLGDDAVIIDTQEGEGKVKVTAAVENTGPKVNPRKTAPPRPSPAPVKKSLKELEQEEQVEELDINHFLSHHGIPQSLKIRIQELAASFDAPSKLVALSSAIDVLFHFEPLNNNYQNRPIMLVGPPGVGKTVTAAKLASQAVLEGISTRLINTDVVRTGALAQLEGFADILQTDIIEVSAPDQLEAAINSKASKNHLTIIDTPGYNPFDMKEMEELHKMITASEVEPILVIAAGTDPLEAREMAETYEGLGVRRFIATRLDVARRYASLISTAEAGNLAFAGVGLTPYLAKGIRNIDSMIMAKLLTRISKRNLFTSEERKNDEQ